MDQILSHRAGNINRKAKFYVLIKENNFDGVKRLTDGEKFDQDVLHFAFASAADFENTKIMEHLISVGCDLSMAKKIIKTAITSDKLITIKFMVEQSGYDIYPDLVSLFDEYYTLKRPNIVKYFIQIGYTLSYKNTLRVAIMKGKYCDYLFSDLTSRNQCLFLHNRQIADTNMRVFVDDKRRSEIMDNQSHLTDENMETLLDEEIYYYDMWKRQRLPIKSAGKNKFLKFILKPMSLHMQLISIE
jgi:hypothetical protein